MVKMASEKTRGTKVSSDAKPDIAIRKLEDAADIVRYPPVFSRDSKYLCIASGYHVGIYSVESGERLHCLKKHKSNVVGLAINNDGFLYSCDSTGEVILWEIANGKMEKKEKLSIPRMTEFCTFLYVGDRRFLVTTPSHNFQHKKTFTLWLVKTDEWQKKMYLEVLEGPNSVAIGCRTNGSTVIAALQDSCVVVKDLASGIGKKHMTDERKFTCVALHHEEFIMATGDISGRIIVWHDFVNQIRPVKTVYHWHTLPVSSICFSSEGGYLYSGGSEKVMVKWRLGMSTKQFLPRMGSSIKFIVNAPDNVCIATSHSDNAIRFISSTNKINRAVLGLVKHDPIRGLESTEPVKESVLPTGLVWDPRSEGIFFNAQAGFLQLFDPQQNSMMFNMDIANRNVLTDERNQIIGNAEVLRVAVSSNGEWLATLEIWSNISAGYHDMKLKFWYYNAVQSNYELNTDVMMPHNDRVTALVFQPGLLGNENPCLVSIGRDHKFKIWRLVDDTDIYRQKEAWTCDVAGDFRKLMPTALSFSDDGSLLAIAFQETVTLWDPMTATLSTTLSHPMIDQHIKFMEFGRDQCFRYLVCATETSLFTWDVITQGLVWKVVDLHSPIQCLVSDPKSSYMASVLKNKEVYLFSPSSSNPVYLDCRMNSSEPISAVFVPRPNPLATGPEWLINSRLLIVDDKQDFFCLDDVSSSESNQKLITPTSHMDSLPWTPFAAMKAQKQITAAKRLVPVVHQTSGVQGYESVKTLMETSASALPPMSRICDSFLNSLMIKHDPKLMTQATPINNGSTDDLSNKVHVLTESKGFEMTDDANLKNLLTYDWQWLLNNLNL